MKLLDAKMKSQWVDSSNKSKTRARFFLLMQNREGSLANDFVYSTAAGYRNTMYELKAEYTLLYFYNPECQACKNMTDALTKSEVVNRSINKRKTKVLAIYTDKDEKVWLSHLPGYPASWIHGRDENEYLYKNSVYDLRAIPTVYLLDKNKKVLLKGCVDVGEVEKVLSFKLDNSRRTTDDDKSKVLSYR
jgi:hypothetical protein